MVDDHGNEDQPFLSVGRTASASPNGHTAAWRTDTLADSVIILLGLTAVQRLVGFCRSILFCRWLDAGQLGQWDLAFSFLMMAAPLSVLSLSGSFNRYIEHYRGRRQLRSYLKRTAILYACLGVPAAATIWMARRWFSQLIFGTAERTELVALLALSLLAVLAMHFFVDLFNALRNVRLIAGMQFFNSLAFAVLGISLLLAWKCAAASVVVAFGGACALTSAGAIVWLRRAWRNFPKDAELLPHRDLWPKVIPFVFWMVLTSLVAQLFTIADRYMIVHYSGMSAAESLARVGDYHSSRVIPLLFVSIALMLGTMAAPHLSCDWEAGRRVRVAERLNLFLKLLGFALVAVSVAVLFASPLFFGVAFRGKFDGGLAVLPWTLVYCTWYGLAMVAHTYLWCAEKTRLGGLALLVGLAVNIGLNLLLLPPLGLPGAVLATTVANLIALVLICTFAYLLGFRMDRGVLVILALPLTVCLGPWIATLILVAIALEAIRSDRLLSAEEKRLLAERGSVYLATLRGVFVPGKPARSSS